MQLYKKLLFNLSALICLFVISYNYFLANDKLFPYKNVENTNSTTPTTSVNNTKIIKNNSIVINIWSIFTKVNEYVPLQLKFKRFLDSLFRFSSVPLHLHIICDNQSKVIAETIFIQLLQNFSDLNVFYSFYNIDLSAQKINDIVEVMTPHFSSHPGSYYSDALFYLSLGLHRIASKNLTTVLLLDCDVQFVQDVKLLYNEFHKFNRSNLFGLTHELSPVYRHVLYTYRNRNNQTTFGDYVHKTTILATKKIVVNHPYGFPGYNSGVMLLNLSAIRESSIYPYIISKTNVERLVTKYKFRGHLGDQDFYTILGYEYSDLIRTLPCIYNRQLCAWWRDHGYHDVFANYSKCEGDVVVYHGNCNTPIPN